MDREWYLRPQSSGRVLTVRPNMTMNSASRFGRIRGSRHTFTVSTCWRAQSHPRSRPRGRTRGGDNSRESQTGSVVTLPRCYTRKNRTANELGRRATPKEAIHGLPALGTSSEQSGGEGFQDPRQLELVFCMHADINVHPAPRLLLPHSARRYELSRAARQRLALGRPIS